MPHTSSELVSLIQDRHDGARWIYDTVVQGQSNQGHEMSLDLTDADKDNVVEYLKTL